MRHGRYKPVTLSRAPVSSPDSDGFFQDLNPAKWWALIEPLDPFASDGTRTMSYRVSGRYRPDITVDTRIQYEGREIFVKGVQNLGEQNRELILYCEEIAP